MRKFELSPKICDQLLFLSGFVRSHRATKITSEESHRPQVIQTSFKPLRHLNSAQSPPSLNLTGLSLIRDHAEGLLFTDVKQRRNGQLG